MFYSLKEVFWIIGDIDVFIISIVFLLFVDIGSLDLIDLYKLLRYDCDVIYLLCLIL